MSARKTGKHGWQMNRKTTHRQEVSASAKKTAVSPTPGPSVLYARLRRLFLSRMYAIPPLPVLPKAAEDDPTTQTRKRTWMPPQYRDPVFPKTAEEDTTPCWNGVAVPVLWTCRVQGLAAECACKVTFPINICRIWDVTKWRIETPHPKLKVNFLNKNSYL